MATPIFTCGFECGAVVAGVSSTGQHWVSSPGISAFEVNTSIVRSGLCSGRIQNPPAAGNVNRISLASSTRWIGRVYINFQVLPSSGTSLIYVGTISGPSVYFNSSDSKIYASVDTTSGASGVSVTTGIWYRIDFDFNINTGGNDTCDVQVAGISCGQATATGHSAAQTDFVIGISSTMTADVYFDDILLSQTAADYPLGKGYVKSYVPDADGSHSVAGTNDFERTLTGTDILNGTTDAYLLVDERPINSTDFINMLAPVNTTDYVECLFEDCTENNPPRAVEIIAGIHQSGTGPGNMEIRLVDNATEGIVYTASSVAGVTSMTYKRAHFSDPPSAASSWILGGGGNGDFNNLKVRFGSPAVLDVNPDQYFDGIMIEAEFSGSPAKFGNEILGIINGIKTKLTIPQILQPMNEIVGIVGNNFQKLNLLRSISEIAGLYEQIKISFALKRFQNERNDLYELSYILRAAKNIVSEIIAISDVQSIYENLIKLINEFLEIYEQMSYPQNLINIINEIVGLIEQTNYIKATIGGAIDSISSLSRRIVAIIGG